MKQVLLYALCAVIGYALGCVSTGVIVSKLYGRIDIRNYGSGNAGMTNVMRTLGWVPSFLTFAGDALKGVLGALIGRWIGGELGMHIGGICAILGHNWPALFRFRGGKGMSTSFGYILVVDWRIALVLLGIQVVVLLISRYMSLASILSACAYVGLVFVFHKSWVATGAAIVTCALALFSHRANMKRLAEGNENRLDSRKITQVSRKMTKALRNRRKKHDQEDADRS